MTNTTTIPLEDLKRLIATVATKKMAYEELAGGYQRDRARLAWTNALADLRCEAGQALPSLIAEVERLREILEAIVAADDAAMAEMQGLGFEPPSETRALTERARAALSGDGG
jgi:hypothetical protein